MRCVITVASVPPATMTGPYLGDHHRADGREDGAARQMEDVWQRVALGGWRRGVEPPVQRCTKRGAEPRRHESCRQRRVELALLGGDLGAPRATLQVGDDGCLMRSAAVLVKRFEQSPLNVVALQRGHPLLSIISPRARRARCSRLFTVPSGISRMAAASLTLLSSQ